MTVPDRTALIVFARTPQPGAAKTRLVPLLGAEGAAALQAKLIKHALQTARGASFSRVELHCTPNGDDPFLCYCKGRYGIDVRAQTEGDLGARMLAAFEQSLAECPRVILIGSDCPALTALHLRQADRALRDGADAAFIPCEDGGYALIALRRVDAKLFHGIDWGCDNVMEDTRARLTALGWTWRELETLWDVDRPEDYERLVLSGLLDKQPAPPLRLRQD